MSDRLIPWLGPIALLGIWHMVALSGLISPILLPAPVAVLENVGPLLLGEDPLWIDIGMTLWRCIAAFALAMCIGVPIGLAMGAFAGLHRALIGTVDFLRSIPPIAIFPVFIMLFGISEAARIAVPFYGAVLVLIVHSAAGVLDAPRIRLSVGRVFGLSLMDRFVHIILPGAVPSIATGARIAVSLSLILVIVVEMTLSAPHGLGRKVYDLHTIFETSSMYMVIIIIGLIGYALNQCFIWTEHRFIAWRGA